MLDCNACDSWRCYRYKTSDRSEFALRQRAMLTSQKNSRGSSNLLSLGYKKTFNFTVKGFFNWWELRGWRQEKAPAKLFLTTDEVLLDCSACDSWRCYRYKTSDRSEFALRQRAMLTSQKNSRGSSNLLSLGYKKTFNFTVKGFFNWWELRGSNSRPSRCKRDALPAELNSHRAYGSVYTLIKIINQAKN